MKQQPLFDPEISFNGEPTTVGEFNPFSLSAVRQMAKNLADVEQVWLAFDSPITYETAEEQLRICATSLHSVRETYLWALGDLVCTMGGQIGFRNTYKIVAQATGSTPQWARELCKVAKIFPAQYRMVGTPWTTYRAAAHAEKPVYVLTFALQRGWGAKEIKAYLKRAKGSR